MWKASDNSLHQTQAEMNARERELTFLAHCCLNKCYGNYAGSYVTPNELKEWLDENRNAVLRYLNR